jgi:signal transduction histidine kinase
MITIRTRLIALVATAAIAPLVAYGVVSMQLLRTATRQSVTAEAQSAAAHAAEQISTYIRHNVDLLEAVAAELQYTALSREQQERVLRNYVLAFPALSELTLFTSDGAPIVSSRLGPPELTLPAQRPGPGERPRIAPIEIDAALLPTTELTIRLDQVGPAVVYLVAGLRLESLWQLVDRIRVGGRGHALLVDDRGRLLAHGDPGMKAAVARGDGLSWHPLIASRASSPSTPLADTYVTPGGVQMLGVLQSVRDLGWHVIVEQPAREAFALALRLERFLAFTVVLGLTATITIALMWGRSVVRPLDALMHGTRALADGRLDERVRIAGRDEFAELGSAFNNMADRLAALRQEAVKQERHATFGRIAAGLVHDLAHPIQNIGNNCKLMLKMYDDADYRETFRRMVDREFAAIKRLLEDLRNLGRPIPLERFPIDIRKALAEVGEWGQAAAERAGLTLEVTNGDEPAVIEGDLFALGRVCRNLVLNAMQATAPGGLVRLDGRAQDGNVRITVEDTGTGIPAERLPHIFDDYVTTKRRGLGLGLAISRKMVEQMGGTIDVTSTVGVGTRFTIVFPERDAMAVTRDAEAEAEPVHASHA